MKIMCTCVLLIFLGLPGWASAVETLELLSSILNPE